MPIVANIGIMLVPTNAINAAAKATPIKVTRPYLRIYVAMNRTLFVKNLTIAPLFLTVRYPAFFSSSILAFISRSFLNEMLSPICMASNFAPFDANIQRSSPFSRNEYFIFSRSRAAVGETASPRNSENSPEKWVLHSLTSAETGSLIKFTRIDD